MVSLEETHQTMTTSPDCLVEPVFSSPRISFSSDFLDESNFISICPNRANMEKESNNKPSRLNIADNNNNFEFLSGNSSNTIAAADELFSEGKLLPFRQQMTDNKLSRITLKPAENDGSTENKDNDVDRRMSWFLDDDPSPRPPKCTVLWKELLRLKKQRGASTLSPSSSSSSSSSSGSSLASSGDERKKGVGNKEKILNRVKKGIERTKSASSIRIRPMVNVPICTIGKNSSLPPLFPLRRGRFD